MIRPKSRQWQPIALAKTSSFQVNFINTAPLGGVLLLRVSFKRVLTNDHFFAIIARSHSSKCM